MIVTIDGPVATGKSSIAKKLASAIGFLYFDTGAMYRALTYGLLQKDIDFNDSAAIHEYLEKFDFRIKVIRNDRHYFLDQEEITDAIRSKEVTTKVSKISAMQDVRLKLTGLQRQLAKGVNAVFEGRDMGTIVFPDAQVKIFLTGRLDVRAKRRYDEILTKYPSQAKDLTLDKMKAEIEERDALDSSRDIAPLKQPLDACVIDTSDLTLDEIVYKILEFKDTLKMRQLK